MTANPVSASVAFAVSKGVPLERILEATGLELAALLSPSARVDEGHMPAIWQVLREAFPGEAITLEMAAAAPLDFLGPFLDAARTAASLREAIGLFLRYQAVLSTNFELTVEEHPRGLLVCTHHALDALDGGCGAEVGLGVAVRAFLELGGLWAPLLEARFSHAPIGPPEAYRPFFNAPVRFRAPHNGLVFRKSALERPVGRYDPAHHKAIRLHLDRVNARLVGEGSRDLARVREAIGRNAERGCYEAEPLARALGMSPRTLQRRLAKHGTTTRALLEEAREAHARELLGDRSLSTDEVAYLLGYSTESAFRRAFRRWTGQSPAGWRAALSA